MPEKMGSVVNVLYVDDEPLNLFLFSSVFKNIYNVMTAESGFTGLDMIVKNKSINVVIADMKMPGMNGIEFIERAREMIPGLDCFIMTGYDVTPEIQKSIDIGLVKQYFRKPMDKNEIISSIDALIT
jgi:response regulator RpfG family c-di-GMP phosphodiesterase